MNDVLGALSSHLHSFTHQGHSCSDKLHYNLTEDGIHVAVLRGDSDVIDKLLTPKTINLPSTGDRATPLHVASAAGSHHIVRKLLQSGCFLHPVDKDGATPLHIASQYGHQDVVSELVSAGADPASKDKYGQTPFYLAHRVKHKAVLKILQHAKRGEHEDRQDQRFSVFCASFARRVQSGNILQADSPGLCSATSSRPALVPMNSEPASPCTLSTKSSTEFEELRNPWVSIPSKSDCSEWLTAVKDANIEKLKSMCSTFGKDILETEDSAGRTALHRAAATGQVDLVKHCLDMGALVDSVDQAGRTPLHWAALTGREDTVSLLLGSLANVNTSDEEHRTPLHYAAAYACEAVVICLVEAGASLAAMDKDAKTPCMWAKEMGNDSLMRLLGLENAALQPAAPKTGHGPDSCGASLRRALSFKSEPPLMFICPITQDIMTDPVVAADGNTYERQAIEEWFKRTDRSPMTNQPVVDSLIPNRVLRSSILDWVESNTRQ